jgi:NAD(P)H dehydrogenase (quinone)
MAQAVAAGAQKVSLVNVVIKTPDKVTEDDLKLADAIILGSPTYYGNMSAQMKAFIDDWFLKYKTSLVNKVGGAFSTGGDESGGKEHVLYSFVIAMMNAGMIIVGPQEGFLGTAGVAAMDPVDDASLKKANSLGERAATIARQFKYGMK